MKNRPEIFQNERVSASAGAGKTYALTKRFIALASKEIDSETRLPDPTKITALTFTRKSAGEFLDKILTRLADASMNAEKSRALSLEVEELTFGEEKDGTYLTQEKILLLLKECVKNLNRMRLSTIDSFFASALTAFSTESGLFSELSVLEDAQLKEEKEKIIDDILQTISTSKKTFATFAEIIKRASFGADEKSLRTTLGNNINDSHQKFIEVPDENLWGKIEEIIDETPIPWNRQEYNRELNELKNLLKNEDYGKSFDGIIKFLEATDNNTVGNKYSTVERTIDLFALGELNNSFELNYNRRTYHISKKIACLLESLYKRILHAHILRVCDASKAAAQIAKLYEERYNTNVRLAGKLAFGDIPILLSKSASLFSNLIEYRLDSRFNHWLFDEFQDTSRQQWSFFRSIIDETVAEDSGDKTFYYVGDVKQSLYSWRGGDRLLFDEVFNNYNAIHKRQVIFDGKELVTSWRSGKHIIDIINSIFEDGDYLKKAFHPESAKQFTKIFTPHISAETLSNAKKAKPSLAQLRFIDPRGKSLKKLQNVCAEIFEIIKQTNPTANGKTCAILVNDNKTAEEIVKYLRERIAEENLAIEVSGELEKNILADNMLASAFLQLLKNTAHPSDTASEVYLKMTPLADLVSRENFRDEIMSTIAMYGIEKVAENVEQYLRKKIKVNQQLEENIELLKSACREFDASQSKGIDNFIEFFAGKKYRISSISTAIQVMTIHKSKGLGFGTVILPDLYNIADFIDRGLKYITQNHNGIRVQKTISYFPPQLVCRMSKVLRESVDLETENESFENICKLYVALTRAEQALYIILPEAKEYDSSNGSTSQLIVNAFEPKLRSQELTPQEKNLIYEDLVNRKIISIGDEKWYLANSQIPMAEPLKQLSTIENPKIPKPFERIVPSQSHNSLKNFDIKKIALGTAIHKAFEFVDTSNDSPEDKAMRAVKDSRTPDAIQAEVYNHLRDALKNPEIANLFLGEKNRIIKTEFSFDVLIDGKIARGSIDRLIINTDNNNKPISATIIDYKSNKNFVDTYKPQVEIYKRAIENIFKIPENKISVKIVSYNDSQITDVI